MAKTAAFSVAEEEWIKEQREREKRRKKKKKRGEEGGALNINSMMDIMVIILVFLLKNYGDEPIKVVGEDLKAPKSTTQLTPEDMMTITVSQRAILVNNKKAVDVKQGSVDKSQKKGGGDSDMQIQPLFDEVSDAIKRKKREMSLIGQPYEPVATIIADQSTPYRLLTEVMYTAGQAELSKFKFAVVTTDRKTFAGAE